MSGPVTHEVTPTPIEALGVEDAAVGKAFGRRGWLFAGWRRTLREGYKYWSTRRFERF